MTRYVDTRVDILRNGAKQGELYSATPGTITFNSDNMIKSSFEGEFYQNEVVNWLMDELRPVLIIDGSEYPCGVFSPVSVMNRRMEDSNVVSIEAYDRCWRVQSTCATNMVHLDAGTNYISAIKSLLSTCGIALVRETATDETLRMDREDWGTGTDYLTIINTLLDEINYNELHFDENGFAVLEPESTFTSANIKRTYNYDTTESLMLEETSTEFDIFNAPNVFIVVCSNPDDHEPMKAVKENNNPSSPLSIMNRGRRISKVYSVSNIASQDALEEYAALLCQESMLLGERIRINTLLMPGCGMNDVVALRHPDAEGMCIETGWEMIFGTGGTMTHTLERMVGVNG